MQASAMSVPYQFETGIPDRNLIPMPEFELLVRDMFTQRSDWLTYSPTQGIASLRKILCQTLLPVRGMANVDPNEVLILTGSLQGIDLLSRLILNRGDSVVVESPTFPGAIQIFNNAGVEMIGLPVDNEGAQVELLPDIAERYRPKLIYIQPEFQNPTGAVLSTKRRTLLLKFAEAYRIPIIEDDAYG